MEPEHPGKPFAEQLASFIRNELDNADAGILIKSSSEDGATPADFITFIEVEEGFTVPFRVKVEPV